MAPKIGPKRLMTLLEQGTDLYALPVQQQFEAFRTMGRLMTQPLTSTPRRLPRRLRPRCGALCRNGWPCKAKAVWDEDHDRPVNGRCKNHGGMSTGPRTHAGRQRIAASNRTRAQARRLAQAQAAAPAQIQEPMAVQAQSRTMTQAQVEALAAYRHALAYYELTRWTESWKAVERAYQHCLRYGLNPRIGKEF
jgi:hypothetical protein